ncbi:MAG: IS4 family transposase [Candidatus Brocadiaceae bacterium]|nr:IS4 family transposase [Candidatus Brocadiaceae bacterium]
MHDPITQSLSTTLKKHIPLWRTRQETLSCLIILILRTGTVSLWRLAAHANSPAKTLSVHRRFERFFQHIHLDGKDVAHLLVSMMGLSGKPWTLALDRTNWKFGRVHINILVLGVIYENLCIPLLWVPLGKAGNSNADERIGLLKILLHIFPAQKIACVLGDREFIGALWLSWMHERGLPFAMRVRENIHIWNADQSAEKICDKAAKLKRRKKMILPGWWYLGPGSTPVQIVIMRLKTGELLVLAIRGVAPKRALALYRERWGIETLFSCLKKRGLGFESTHMSLPRKISTLMAVLAITFCMAFKTGLWVGKQMPPRKKKHGFPALSLFALGVNVLRKAMAVMKESQISQCFIQICSNNNLRKPLLEKAF